MRILLRPLVIIGTMFLALNVYSQSSILDTVFVSGTYGTTQLLPTLEKIEADLPVKFYFNTQDTSLLKINPKPTSQKGSLQTFLNQILLNTGYHFVFLPPGNIILMPEHYTITEDKTQVEYTDKIVIGNQRDRGKYKTADLSGTVRDGKTGSPQVGVVVYAVEADKGSVTNPGGRYSITLVPGKNTLQFSSVGFETVEKEIEFISDGELDINLFEESVAINEVVVTRQRPDKNVSRAQMSTVEMTSKEIKSIPTLMGEADLIKSLTLMPGVQTLGEASAGFNIRGGNIDQNLILIDGTPIFNTSHLFGFFSTIQPSVINDVTLFKGNIPAMYGGRVSSVMNIGIKESQVSEPALSAGIGLINARVNTEIPIIKNKLSLIAGARSTYSDWLLNLIATPELRESSAGYYDMIGKLKWQINSNNSFSLFGYQSSDNFNLANTTRYYYGNKLANIHYKHIFSGRVSLGLQAGISDYNLHIESEEYKDDPEAKSIRSGIKQVHSKLNLTFIPLSSNTLDLGVELNQLAIHPGEQQPLTEQSVVEQKTIEREQGYELAFFLSDNYEVFSWLGLSAGLRYTLYNYHGKKTVFSYAENSSRSPESIIDTNYYASGETIKKYQYPEPRISLRFSLDGQSSLKTGYNRNVQYLQLLSNTSASTPTDVWKLSDTYIQPLLSHQFSIGYFRNFKDNTLETSIEAYYKKLQNLIDYKNGAVIIMNEHIESDIVSGSGEAYGIELMVRKNTGRLSGWIGYTFSRTYKNTISRFKEDLVNKGKYYPAAYDKPHDISSSINYRLSRRWSIAGNFVYSSGRPATLPEYQFEIDDRRMVYFSDRNKYRLPDYHRLDLSITFHGHIRAVQKYISSWTFSIYNVYGRNNPYSVYYTKDQPTAANQYQQYVLYKLSVVNRPIPTISYNFKF